MLPASNIVLMQGAVVNINTTRFFIIFSICALALSQGMNLLWNCGDLLRVRGTIIRWHLGCGPACRPQAEIAAGIEEWDCETSLWSEQEMWENLTNKQDMEHRVGYNFHFMGTRGKYFDISPK